MLDVPDQVVNYKRPYQWLDWHWKLFVNPGLTMSSFTPHVCPLTEIPLAAVTITSVFCRTYPLIAFVYGSKDSLPEVPYGKRELLTIYLRRLGITGLVLSVDSEDEKCVGVAVWTAPAAFHQKSLYEQFKSKLKLIWLNIWLFFASVYYHGASMDAQVTTSLSAYGVKETNRTATRRLGYYNT